MPGRGDYIGGSYPLRRASVPARGGECLSGLFEMVCEQRSAFVEMFVVLLLDRSRDRSMHDAATLQLSVSNTHSLSSTQVTPSPV